MWDLKVLSNFLILIALLIAMYVWYFIMYQELKSRGESIDSKLSSINEQIIDLELIE